MDVHSILNQYNLKPNDVLGQNFLKDNAILKRIADEASVKSGDRVIEIGPGIGNLTRFLLEYGAEVTAIEKDRKFKPVLKDLAREFDGKLKVVWQDALTVNFYELGLDAQSKIIGNIPYYITGRLLHRLSELRALPASITLLVQKEVADRLTAEAGEMSLLAVAAQLYFSIRKVFEVPSASFFPEPEVDSAVVIMSSLTDEQSKVRTELLRKYSTDSISLNSQVLRLAKAAFAGKRKTLLNSLSGNLQIPKERVVEALDSIKIDPSTRPQEIAMDQWLHLACIIK